MNAAPGGSNKPKQRDKQDKPRAAEHQNIIIQQLSIQTGTAIRLVAVLNVDIENYSDKSPNN